MRQILRNIKSRIQKARAPEKLTDNEVLLARLHGFGDPRNTVAYIRAQLARVQWLNANAAEAERRRKAALEASPHRLARLKRAAEKRRRKAAKRATEAYAL